MAHNKARCGYVVQNSELYGRALVVLAAEQYAAQLVLPAGSDTAP